MTNGCASAPADRARAPAAELAPSRADDVAEKQKLIELDARFQKAMAAYERGAFEDSIQLYRSALGIEDLPAVASAIRGELYYQIACNESRLGRTEDAWVSLAQAARHGYTNAEHAARDPDLEPLSRHERFARVLESFRDNERKRVYEVVRSDSPDLGWASLHRFEDIESAPFAELRAKYRLSEVARGKTELDKQLALLEWVHDRWHHTGLNEPAHADALTILREVEAGERFRCVEYSVVMAQVAQALGYPARVIDLRVNGASFGLGREHVVAEVWNNDLQKWIVMDGQNNGTWQVDGFPLSAAEVREARISNPERLRFVLGPSRWMTVQPEPEQRAVWVRYFEHLSFRFANIQPLGSDHGGPTVDLLHPAEKYELLFQSAVNENRVQTSDIERVYPALGRVHADLSAVTAGKPEIRLALTHSMPWFSQYLVRRNGSESSSKEQTISWPLQPGRNEIVIVAVNAMGVAGKPTTVVVDFTPDDMALRAELGTRMNSSAKALER